MEGVKEKTDFTVFPAIDLRGGKVVRLAQGDPNRQTVYGDDPLEAARRWLDDGASWIHVVNLDGAFGEATAANVLALAEILRTGLKVQFGGGMRDLSGIQRAFDAGVSRIVIGTAAVDNPKLIDVAMRKFSAERIAVGIDSRAGKAHIRGWKAESDLTSIELGKRIFSQGVRWCIFTDIERDGVSAGVNIPATVDLARQTGLRVIASGGVSALKDILDAARAELAGIIIGRALYEGSFSLRSALDCVR